ncbi:vascular endothelial growth factor receptor 3-like isoform X2 [Planococcus citri]|uniref:vascular endothelial growth factor receptor 3-like isoform X2 n=1 Tax=Planococcus citri TaxID=170843 RepID=UPI0031F7BB0C
MKIELFYGFFLLLSSIFLIEGIKISSNKGEPVIIEVGKNAKVSLTSLSCLSNGPVELVHHNGTVLKPIYPSTRVQNGQENWTIPLNSNSYTYLDTGNFKCRSKNNHNDADEIYVYFFDENHFLAMNKSLVLNVTNSKVNNITLPCRPTSPNVKVELKKEGNNKEPTYTYDPKVGYNVTKPNDQSTNFTCTARYRNSDQTYKIQVLVHVPGKNQTTTDKPHNDNTTKHQTTTIKPHHDTKKNQTNPDNPPRKPNPGFLALVKEKWYVFAGGVAVLLVIILSLLIFVCSRKKSETPTSEHESKPAAASEWELMEPIAYLSTLRSEQKPFEFPPEKLECSNTLLGSGNFGVIRKALANGITEEGISTVVAVRIYKCDSPLFMKAINEELKTMIYLGHHVNIVNLLGACTGNSPKGELSMIVEYCKYGNLRDFILKRRTNYLKQFKNKNQLELASRRSVMSENQRISVLSHGPTIESQEYLLSDSKMYDPKWDLIDYGDYSDSQNVPIKIIDFITWSFQIASGMEYLASRQIVHGDLAARNILLAEGNMVKISAVGVSKSMYEVEEYKNRRIALPVKWMAIESIQDKEFTIESDIWSFAMTMWEIFSLALAPYAGIEHAANLLDKLLSGHRPEQPKFAPDEIYAIMKICWNRNPKLRLSFTKLREALGRVLEEFIQSHHTNLNKICEKTKAELEETDNYLRILNSYKHPTPAENPSTLFDNPGYAVLRPSNEQGGNNTRPVSTMHFTHGNPTLAQRHDVRWSYTNGPVSYKR